MLDTITNSFTKLNLLRQVYAFERKTGYLAHCAVGQITFFLSKSYTSMREQPPASQLAIALPDGVIRARGVWVEVL